MPENITPMKPLSPEDFHDLKVFFADQQYKLSIYSLPSLLVWTNAVYKPHGTVIDGALAIGYEFNEKHEDKRHLILPVAPGRDFPPEELVEIAGKLEFDKYCLVPEEYVEKHENLDSFFEISEEPGCMDYVYRAEDLAELKGNRYAKKRNLVNQFKKLHLNNGGVSIEKIRAGDAGECIDFLEKWCEERCCEESDDLACERDAAINILKNIENLDVNGMLLRLNGTVSAFAVASRLTGNMGALHFEKAFAGVKGLYQYFDRECAKRLFNGFEYINKESDMDIPGLAKAKKSYHPVMTVKSYELKIR